MSKRLDGGGAVTSRKILRVLGFYLETLKFIKLKIQYRSLLTFKYLMSASMTKLVGLTTPIQVNILACQNCKTLSNIKNIDNYLFTLMAVR